MSIADAITIITIIIDVGVDDDDEEGDVVVVPVMGNGGGGKNKRDIEEMRGFELGFNKPKFDSNFERRAF